MISIYRFILFAVFTSFLSAQALVQTSVAADTSLPADLPVQEESSRPSSGSLNRTSLSVNPDISAIGDFRSLYTTEGPRNVETYFNALEVQLSSVVDPYAEAKFLFSFGKDSLNGEFSAGLEVATLTSRSLPYSLQVTLGKFKPHFTKVNTLHPHALSFVEFPLMIGNFFGDEGLFMEGVSASVLVPNPWDFYQELTFEAGRSASTPALGNGAGNTLLYAANLNNFFELSDNSTVGFGVSVLTGVNSLEMNTVMAGIDLTYKWKPVQFNTYHSFTWQTEAMLCSSDTSAGNAMQSYGAYTLLEYQLSRRTFIGTRFDYSGLPMMERSDARTASLLLRFQPSEFQILALEFQHINSHYGPKYQQVVFRAIFGIGTHAAHAY